MKEKYPRSRRKGEINYKNLEPKGDEEGRIIFYDKSCDKEKRKDENKEWEFLINQNELELMKKIKKEFDNTKNKNEKDENKRQKKADESQNNKNTSQNNQFTNYRFLLSLEKIYHMTTINLSKLIQL